MEVPDVALSWAQKEENVDVGRSFLDVKVVAVDAKGDEESVLLRLMANVVVGRVTRLKQPKLALAGLSAEDVIKCAADLLEMVLIQRDARCDLELAIETLSTLLLHTTETRVELTDETSARAFRLTVQALSFALAEGHMMQVVSCFTLLLNGSRVVPVRKSAARWISYAETLLGVVCAVGADAWPVPTRHREFAPEFVQLVHPIDESTPLRDIWRRLWTTHVQSLAAPLGPLSLHLLHLDSGEKE